MNKPFFNRFGLEMIDFQKDNFGKLVENVMERIHKDIDDNKIPAPISLEDSDYAHELTELFKKRMGMNIKFHLSVEITGMAVPFVVSGKNILVPRILRDAPAYAGRQLDNCIDLLKKDTTSQVGHVDTKKAKVGGIFSKTELNCYLNVYDNYLSHQISPAENTAVLLHEVGHLFTYLEYSDRLTETNMVMLDVAEHIFTGNEKNPTYIFKEISKIGEISEEEAKSLATVNRLMAGIKLASIFIKAVGSATKGDKYSETSAEFLADAFATRFGYGRYLVSALEKLGKTSGSMEYSTTAERAKMQMKIMLHSNEFKIALAVIVVLFVGTGAALFMLPISVITGILSLIWISYESWGIAGYEMRYDTLKDRYLRVRQQYISSLKQEKMSVQELRQQIEAVEALDQMIASVKPFSPLLTTIANLVGKANRDAKKDVAEQQLLEALTNNDLFLMSAKFKTLSN